MKKLNVLLIFIFYTVCAQAQMDKMTQVVRGTVVDAGSKYPLIGVNVHLTSDTSRTVGTTTDLDGNFRIENVPVGRQALRFSYVGYQDAPYNNIIVTSSREVIMEVGMEEAPFALQEVVVTASSSGRFEVGNEMALTSVRGFSVEETDRYAGSRGDPARMASNFAGVQGADDSRNDIVVRGNSPNGVLWQLEGASIPNPNHFSMPGTAGGPVSIINNKILANSDFYTGAFPAEFGNSTAGVFDLKLRNGNNQSHEYSAQVGFLGMELAGEGPLASTSRASYLFTYRYSTVSLFSLMGINIGTRAVPKYQDASFKVNFPLKNSSVLSVFGLGGNSDIDILVSDQEEPADVSDLYAQNDRDQFFGSKMAVAGAKYARSFNSKTFFYATVLKTYNQTQSRHDLIFRHTDANNKYVYDSLWDVLGYRFSEGKWVASASFFKKLNNRTSLKAGIQADQTHYYFADSAKNEVPGQPDFGLFKTRWNTDENAFLIQPYIQAKFQWKENLTFNAGLHSQYFTLNNTASWLEPRLGLKWNLPKNQSLNLAFGMHSQTQSGYMYFYAPEGTPYNLSMDFSKSIHYVLAYDRFIGDNMRLKTEVYYQDLFNVPVGSQASSFSLVNSGAGFERFYPQHLQNTGTGDNYGIEMTLERSFVKGYYFLFTGSLFESFYEGSDGVKRDTDFNGNYAFNGLFSKEYKVGESNTFSIGAKTTFVGGRRFGPIDTLASVTNKQVVYKDETRNSQQFKDYFRADLKVNYIVNRPKVTHEFAVDLVNLPGTKNILKLSYVPGEDTTKEGRVIEEYQLGFLPIFYYRVGF